MKHYYVETKFSEEQPVDTTIDYSVRFNNAHVDRPLYFVVHTNTWMYTHHPASNYPDLIWLKPVPIESLMPDAKEIIDNTAIVERLKARIENLDIEGYENRQRFKFILNEILAGK